jgi:tripartite-type tricarboxylate transporter receptor subunit TctC
MIHQRPLLRRRSVVAALGAAALAPASGIVRAQGQWPNKPLRILVPFAAGISPDIVARMIADPLSRALGQPVIVENKAGASGMIGAEAAARSPADGYTVFMTVESLVGVLPHVYSKLPYDHFRDFMPVTQVVSVPYYLVTATQQPFRDVRDVIARAKQKPGAMDFGTLGVGSGAHVRMAMFNNMAGTFMTHIPYKTSPMPDLIAGMLTVVFEPATTALPLIRGGKLRALAVTSARRQPAMPEVPTVAETLPGYVADGWQAFVVPTGTPREVVQRLNTETRKILASPDIVARLAELGLLPMGSTPEAFATAMRQEYDKWGKIARDNQIHVE